MDVKTMSVLRTIAKQRKRSTGPPACDSPSHPEPIKVTFFSCHDVACAGPMFSGHSVGGSHNNNIQTMEAMRDHKQVLELI